MDAIAQNSFPPSRRRIWIGALVVFAVTLGGALSLLSSAPSNTSEEHFYLGQHLRNTGILSINNQPAFYRPPGFPLFVAAVLWVRDCLGVSLAGERAVVLAHGLLLSLGAVLIFGYLVRTRPVVEAAAFGCLWAFHPVALIIATNVSYPALHLALVVAGTLALAAALRAGRRPAAGALVAGAIWGLATLVRPTSLILPPFVFLLAHWEYGSSSWRRTLRFGAVFTLGMILAIAPYTWRNYRLSGRLIAVNAQAGFQFWGISVEKTPPDRDYPDWSPLWATYGMPIFTRVTGRDDYRIAALYARNLPLNDAFAQKAKLNITKNPGVYIHNVLKTFYLFNTDDLAWWIYRFGTELPDDVSIPRDHVSIAEVFSVALTVLGFLGLVRGICRGEVLARTLLVIYAMFCLASSIVFPAARYNYVRLPLIILAVPLLLQAGQNILVRLPLGFGRPARNRSFSVAPGTLFAVFVAGYAAAVSLLFL